VRESAKIVAIVSCDAGGAHASAAASLSRSLSAAGWRVEVLDAYGDLLTGIDPFSIWRGWNAAKAYNEFIQKRGWTGLFWTATAAFGGLALAALRQRSATKIAASLRCLSPRLVVSVVPLLNRIVAEAVTQACEQVPFVTVVLDLKECATGVWIDTQDQHVACFTEEVERQALAFGVHPHRVHRVRPLSQARVGQAQDIAERALARARLGVGSQTCLLVTFGAVASVRVRRYARVISRLSGYYTIYVCGRNDGLRRDLEAFVDPSQAKVLGFVRNMSALYLASDIVVSKPGPMTILEATQCGRPLVLELNGSTLIQERFHAVWAKARDLAVSFRGRRDLELALTSVAAEGWQERHAAAIRAAAFDTAPECWEVLDRLGAPLSVAVHT
jgi:monogalactosyldiacylglycerol (MGDG) synthase/glycosyl transferase family 28